MNPVKIKARSREGLQGGPLRTQCFFFARLSEGFAEGEGACDEGCPEVLAIKAAEDLKKADRS